MEKIQITVTCQRGACVEKKTHVHTLQGARVDVLKDLNRMRARGRSAEKGRYRCLGCGVYDSTASGEKPYVETEKKPSSRRPE